MSDRIEPKLDSIGNLTTGRVPAEPMHLIEAVTRQVEALNGKGLMPSVPDNFGLPQRPALPFETIAEQLAASILESANNALLEAQNNLEEAKRYADALTSDIRKRADDLSDLTERLKSFGHSVLAAHEKFQAKT